MKTTTLTLVPLVVCLGNQESMQQRIGHCRILIGGFPATVVPDQRMHINVFTNAVLEDSSQTRFQALLEVSSWYLGSNRPDTPHIKQPQGRHGGPGVVFSLDLP